MKSWIDVSKFVKVDCRMNQYWCSKTKARVFDTWRNIKSKKNIKRLQIHLIREKLHQNPNLGRPLKALRQFTLFKAWNKLF